MILKSYGGDGKRDFELEKEAFLGLQSSDEVPILRYLGSYTHEYDEGKDVGKTCNLLLEYGDNDLYQAWADETNVPPVQAQEILQSWKTLFKIAEAIRRIHKLEIPRGKDRPLKYHGYVPLVAAHFKANVYEMARTYQAAKHHQRARKLQAS